MKKEPTFRDFQEAKPAELKKVYNLNDRQLEQAYRKQIDGCDANARRGEYEKLYRRNRHDFNG